MAVIAKWWHQVEKKQNILHNPLIVRSANDSIYYPYLLLWLLQYKPLLNKSYLTAFATVLRYFKCKLHHPKKNKKQKKTTPN